MTSSPPEPRDGFQDDPPDLWLLLKALTHLLEDIGVVWEERGGQLSEADALRAVALLRAVRRFREAHSGG